MESIVSPRPSVPVQIPLWALALALALPASVAPALAQVPPPPPNGLERPPKLEPLPDIPPPPAAAGEKGKVAPSEEQPQVTRRMEGDDEIEEYRVHGHLYAIRVVPKVGKPYTMVDPNGNGHFENAPDQADNPAGSPVRPPHWVLFEF